MEIKKRGIDSFWLKIIAIIGMTLDHAGIVFAEHLPLWGETLLYSLGGLTFPIMAFMLCEGYRHTRSVKNYAVRLLVFALITQIPYQWALMNQLNVLFTLLLGLLAIHCTQKVENKALKALICILLTGVSIFCDWGLMGVPMVILYYYVDSRWGKLIYPILIPIAAMGVMSAIRLSQGDLSVLPQLSFVLVGCTLTVPLLARYSGEQGRPLRYFFYAYYPLHIAVLGLIKGLIYGEW